MHQGAGDGNALLLATGEAVGKGFATVEQADGVQQGFGGGAGDARGDAFQLKGQYDVLQDIQGGDEVEELEDESDILAAEEGAAVLVQGGELDAIQVDGAAIRLVDAADQVEQGALAAAALADDGGDLAAA